MFWLYKTNTFCDFWNNKNNDKYYERFIFVGSSRRIVWVSSIVLWDWRLKELIGSLQVDKSMFTVVIYVLSSFLSYQWYISIYSENIEKP